MGPRDVRLPARAYISGVHTDRPAGIAEGRKHQLLENEGIDPAQIGETAGKAPGVVDAWIGRNRPEAVPPPTGRRRPFPVPVLMVGLIVVQPGPQSFDP